MFKEAWHKWKAMRFPWRTRYLVGQDLQGNTFWEFRESRHTQRFRRIVQYPRSTHVSDVKVDPVWHQWLRYLREHPPSIQEQQMEVSRQVRMKRLAAEADARWEAKPRVMDAPGQPTGQPLPALNTAATQPNAPETQQVNSTPNATEASETQKKYGKDPWAKAKDSSSGEWQPESWSPPAAKRR